MSIVLAKMISHKFYQSYRLKYLTSTLFNLAKEEGEISINKTIALKCCLFRVRI